ncbi:MAG TPA: carboxypeptidase-like regulatory domain-containing protein [Bryobacteraceae bacterium]|nr:carboxypeptidase-like regulatory domain-containing protein [Bryobacteraceae bacterium]
MRWLILSVFLAANLLAQQAVTGAIGGTITDPDGHAVGRVPVQAANVATKVVYRATSSATGEYSIAPLPFGTYQLTTQVSTAAFQPFVRDNLQVTPGQTVKLDIHLEEGIALNTLGDGRDFFQGSARSGLAPAGATPRLQDGKPDLSGYWAAGGFGPGALLLGPQSDLGAPEFQDWAAELSRKRLADNLRDLPSAHCLPGGIVAAVTNGTPQRIVQTPGLLVMFAEGQIPRQIFLDGRSHPGDPNPTWLGHSVGRWEGDTLVVDSIGFNDKTWLDLNGHPHTENLHLMESYRRPDLGHLELEMKVEDSEALKKPWIVKRTYNLDPKEDIMEAVCLENEKDAPHLFGK